MSLLDDIRAMLGQAQQPLRDAVPNAGQAIQNLGSSLAQSGQAIAGLPGNMTRGVGTTIGQLVSGNPDAADTARRTLNSTLFPDQAVTGEEVLHNAGVRNVSQGGAFAAGLLTDPSALVAGAQLAGAAGRGGRSLLNYLAPQAEATAARATAPAVEGLASAPGLSGYRQGTNGWERLPPRPLATTSRTGANGESLINSRVGDAENWTGRASVGLPMELPATAAGPGAGSNYTNLRNLRDQFTVVRDAGFDAANNPTFGRAIGGPASNDVIQQNVQRLLLDRGTQGVYHPDGMTATILRDALPGTARHEIFHGLMDVARETGNSAGLSLPARMSNYAQQTHSPLLQGLGFMGEEALAHGVQAHGLMPQLRNVWRFLDNPAPWYADSINRISPLAGSIYRSAAIPNAARMGAAGAGAAGAYAGGRALFGE